MKRLINLEGVKILDKSQQKSIHGGVSFCDPCAGKPVGAKCRAHCGLDPGECVSGGICACW